jgi:hypothetical protein
MDHVQGEHESVSFEQGPTYILIRQVLQGHVQTLDTHVWAGVILERNFKTLNNSTFF